VPPPNWPIAQSPGTHAQYAPRPPRPAPPKARPQRAPVPPIHGPGSAGATFPRPFPFPRPFRPAPTLSLPSLSSVSSPCLFPLSLPPVPSPGPELLCYLGRHFDFLSILTTIPLASYRF